MSNTKLKDRANEKVSAESKPDLLRQPVQTRSRATLERIFAGTKELLKNQRFSEISIQQIATAANCGVGTVYGRFQNKTALLSSLEAEVIADIVERQDSFIAEYSRKDVDFETRIEKLIAHIFAGYKRNGTVLRELISRIHQNSKGADQSSRQAMSQLFNRDVEFLVESLNVSSKAEARKVVGIALMSAIVTIQNRLLQLDTSPISASFSESFLKNHLAKMAAVYIRSEYPNKKK